MICCLCRYKKRPGDNISFHRFPENQVKKLRWATALRLNQVCSRHFTKSDFLFRSNVKKLKSLAVPPVSVISDSVNCSEDKKKPSDCETDSKKSLISDCLLLYYVNEEIVPSRESEEYIIGI